MTKASGRKADPAKAIVDIAQADLTLDAFMEEILGAFDEAIGADTAIAVRADQSTLPFVTYNADARQIELVERSQRFMKTRYADDLLPAFAHSARVGAFLDSEHFSSERKKLESIYYREVLIPAGVRSMLHICARWQGRPLLRLNLNRHGSRTFDRSDLEKALYLLPTLEAAVAARFASEPSPGLAGLTQREREIADLVAQGLTTSQIGVALGTSPYTVRNQLTRIFEKLEIESRAELAAYVARSRPG